MSLTIEIMPPSGEAKQLAVKTRAKLTGLLDAGGSGTEQGIQALSKDVISGKRTAGAASFTRLLNDSPDVENAAYALVRSFHSAFSEGTREDTYILEGAVKAFHATLHRAGLKVTPEVKGLVALGLNYQYGNEFTYRYASQRQLSYGVPYRPFVEQVSEWGLNEYTNGRYGTGSPGHASAVLELAPWIESIGTQYIYGEEQQLSLPYIRPMVIPYMDVDGPWVAGMLTPSDTLRMRFSRVRLGAWLASLGVPDEEVRDQVEKVKTKNSTGTFRVYPNDTLFGDIYQSAAISSCMAHAVCDYETWDGIHPCDVYSTSWHGRGDNGLCMIVQMHDRVMVGRGMYNVHTNKIVRWYGEHSGQRALVRAGVHTDSYALKGAWLALIKSGRKFIAPYVDGDVSGGEVDEDASIIKLVTCGEYDLCETSGVIGRDTVWCADDEDNWDRDEATYQPEHNYYISPNCEGWRCPVIGEWCHENDRACIHLDGEEVEVSSRVANRMSTYLTTTEATPEMLEEYGIEDDEGDMDYSDVPLNYTGRGSWATVTPSITRNEFTMFDWTVPPPVSTTVALAAASPSAPTDGVVNTGCPCEYCRSIANREQS